ncbi:MAG: glycerol-3-phosphate cytidylyltransferase [Ignavibacteria bacterium GWB2_35_12]|nr:MAG: glycerol-3-phosphate cytidylyltransferase [Ignavibacteria bacterium GWB2_35_12]OGU94520.1 MAG: glycerol-3-phosphate cytidylyltransferase [Ignavibacteria bacterium RIFOXYA2_FULL_35_10]OGV19070.1 MAG: glycerol-3-phosphate cytidylyltransferase [Ignavibacteria bacterium RIFOXYC2_FULL_35_21]
MIVTKKEISGVSEALKSTGKKVVFTNGCFDIIHAGHVDYLKKARELGDVLIVGLNTDDSVRRIKGAGRPVNNENDRAVVLDSLRFVDYVIFFDEDTPYKLIKKIQPGILVKGGDYSIETIIGADIVLGIGGKVITIPLSEGKSTSGLIEKIKQL